MTEQELANRCAHGDNEARKELYLTYISRIRLLCRRYAANAEDAEDMMHDAFVKIFKVIGQFKWTRPGSLYSWMARITLNMAFDSAKKRQRLGRALVEPGNLEEPVTENLDYEVAASLPFEILEKMIEALPEGYKTVYKLHDIDELSHVEIAKLLGIKEKSSSANLARARAILARNIKKYLTDRSNNQI